MSDSRSPWPLPERPSLDQLRKQAKELRATERHATLAAAQLALARHYGYASWTKLKLAVELTQLRAAIEGGDNAGVRALLAANPKLARGPFADGSTPLHLAAERNDSEMIELLVQHGGRLDQRYAQSNHTALSWALTTEAFDAARKLVELGSEPDLFCAAGLGDLVRVKRFWTDDGQLHGSPSRTGSSRTTESGERLPSPPREAADQISDALYIAARLGHVDVSRWLLDHGADPNWRGYCGATCLAWAEFSGNTEVCALLRERGASSDVTDFEFGATPRVFPVMVFASWGFARRLAERLTADPSLVQARARVGTVLHVAAESGHVDCVRVLLALRADPSAIDASGQTPAERAAAKGHHEIASML